MPLACSGFQSSIAIDQCVKRAVNNIRQQIVIRIHNNMRADCIPLFKRNHNSKRFSLHSTTMACRVYFTISCTDVPERIEYKLAVMIRRCLEDKAPMYLSDYFIPVTAVSNRHLRSVNQHQLTVPRCRRITFGHRAFSVAGPMVWNSLPTEFRDLSVGFDVFRRTVKTILFARY